MTTAKTKSSVLVITTLGVYLGLLLVGGTAPQVLAHSANTRNFEISEEIEIHDDLDTDPDEGDRTDSPLTNYLENLEFLYNFFDVGSLSDAGAKAGAATAKPRKTSVPNGFAHLPIADATRLPSQKRSILGSRSEASVLDHTSLPPVISQIFVVSLLPRSGLPSHQNR